MDTQLKTSKAATESTTTVMMMSVIEEEVIFWRMIGIYDFFPATTEIGRIYVDRAKGDRLEIRAVFDIVSDALQVNQIQDYKH